MIDIEKFICSLLADHPVGVTVREDIHKALKDQGLEYKDGKIVPIEDKTTLQESEDERIRKNLIELFHDTVSNDEIFSDYGLDKTEVLAWLEKQGEQKHVWKPSDLQIEALESATANCAYSEYEDCLTDLIKQLKKLREV